MSAQVTFGTKKPVEKVSANHNTPLLAKTVSAGVGNTESTIQAAPVQKLEEKSVAKKQESNVSGESFSSLRYSTYYNSYL